MKTINIAKLKNNLSAVLSKLKASGAVTVYDRTTPIAVIYPYQSTNHDSESDKIAIERLAREGNIKLGESPLEESFFKTAPARLSKKTDVVKMLIDSRGDR